MNMWELSDTRKKAMSAFGSMLEKEMAARGWDGLEMERQSGVPDATISRIINKGSRPSPLNVGKIAKALKKDVAELMTLAGYGGDLSPTTNDEKLLIAEIRAFSWLRALVSDITALSPQDQRTVRDLVTSLRRQKGSGDSGSPEPE